MSIFSYNLILSINFLTLFLNELSMKKFGKFLTIFFLSTLILLIIAIVGGYFFLKNVDIKQYKPHIVRMAAETLGRAVDFKDIDLHVSVEQGIRLHLTDFIIAEDPAFGTDPFLSVPEIDAGFDLPAFLKTRRISIPNIFIRSLHINLVRNASGAFNAQSLGPRPSVPQPPSSASRLGQAAVGLPVILIEALKIENAAIQMIDLSTQPETKLSVNQLNFEINHFSLTHPFDVLLEAAVLSSQKNLRLSFKTQLNLLDQQARLSGIEIAADLGLLVLDELRRFPLLSGLPIPQVLSGTLKTHIKELVVSDKGIGQAIINVSLINGKCILPNAAPGISLESDKIDVNVENFMLDGSAPFRVNLKAGLFQTMPNVEFSGLISFNPKTLDISISDGQFSTNLALLPLATLRQNIVPLKDIPLPQGISGTLQVTIKQLEASPIGLKQILMDAALADATINLAGMLPGITAELAHTELNVQNFSLEKPFSILLKTGLFNDSPNITFFAGDTSVDLEDQTMHLAKGTVHMDLHRLSLEKLKTSGLIPANVPLPEILGGEIHCDLKNLEISPKGLDRLIADIRWDNGQVVMHEVSPGISLTAQQINLHAKDFSLKDPFSLQGSLAYENETPNLTFQSTIAVDLAQQSVRLSEGAIFTDLSQWSMERLKSAVLALKDAPLPETLNGKMNILIKQLAASPKGLDDLLADLALTEGHVKMTNVAPGISLEASLLEAQVKNFSLSAPFTFNLSLAYLHDNPNIDLKGTASVDLNDQTIHLKDTTLDMDLSTFDLEQLKTSVSALKDAHLPENLAGKFSFSIPQLSAGAKGLINIDGHGALTDGLIKMKELVIPLQGLNTTFQLTSSDMIMDTLTASLGQGQINADFRIKDYLASQAFAAQAELKEINLTEILDQKQTTVKVEGLLDGQLKAQGQAKDLNSITAEGAFDVKAAKLKDLNVLKTVLDSISFLPDVSARLEANLPDHYKEKLQNKDTDIKKVSLAYTIANGNILINPTTIEADEFLFSGETQAGFDQKYTMNGHFKIPAELSAAMTQDIEEMQYLYDEAGNIALPIHVQGQGAQVPSIDILQTAGDIIKNAIRNKGKEELKKALFDKFLREESSPQEQPATNPQDPGQQQQPQEEKQPSPESEIIDQIFDRIFK
jgi:hypothetical protein